MGYKNFEPEAWAQAIECEMKKMSTALSICNGKHGEEDLKYAKLSTPEALSDGDAMSGSTRKKSFDFMVGDIDQRQAKGDLMLTERDEVAAGMAKVLDSFIYGLYGSAGKTIIADNVTTANIHLTLADALTQFCNHRVPQNETIYAEVSSEFAMKLVLAKIMHDADNSDIMHNGIIGTIKPFNLEVRMSNNIESVDGADKIFIRTQKAIAAAVQLTEVEAYRPERCLSDAVKGILVYGAKVVRPKELIVISAKYGTETTM